MEGEAADDVVPREGRRSGLPVGAYDPLLGYSYTEIGGIARSQHHSQAMGSPQPVGAADCIPEELAGEPARDDLMEGIPYRMAASRFRTLSPQWQTLSHRPSLTRVCPPF